MSSLKTLNYTDFIINIIDTHCISHNNFLWKTERGSITNQMNILHQLSQSKLMSTFLKTQNSSKPAFTLNGMAWNKNLHMKSRESPNVNLNSLKSSISKKLLKAFKMNHEMKEDVAVKAKNDFKRKSMQFGEMKNYGSEKLTATSYPDNIKIEWGSKEASSRKLSGASSRIK